MRLPAVTAMAAAGKAAAGMSRRFVDRYVDPRAVRSLVPGFVRPAGRPQPGRSAEFAAHIASSPQIGMRLGSLAGDARALIGTVSRATPGAATFARQTGLDARPRPGGKNADARVRLRPAVSRVGRPLADSGPGTTPDLTLSSLFRRPASDILIGPAAVTTSDSDGPVIGPVFGDGDTQETSPAARALPAEAVPEQARTEAPALARFQRPEVPAEAPAQNAPPHDYRRLRPTLLRDTLRRRGGTGTPLEVSLREKLRGPLRFDPALARLHRSPVAADAARALGAQAFTIGRDVFFGEGRFEPTATAGLELLAHELTHVGQQARLSGDQMRFFTASGGDGMEEEAQQTAARVREMTQTAPTGVSRPSPTHTEIARPVMQLARFEGGPSTFGGTATVSPLSAPPVGAGAAPNAREITDHVYSLMKKELRQGSRRGQVYRKG